MLACACGGILEVGLFTLIVTTVSAVITRVINRVRRRRYHRALALQIVQYAEQSNQELSS